MRKYLNFDLDTNKLKEFYPNKNYTQAYDDIKKFLLKNGFEHRQGSGYISEKDMINLDIADIIKELNKKYSWLKDCCKTFDYYDVGETFSALDILNNDDNSNFSKNTDNNKYSAMQKIRDEVNSLIKDNDKSKDISKVRKNK